VVSSGPRVLALGATKLDGEDVWTDPAGIRADARQYRNLSTF
jgi:hypothetical protein